MDALFTEAARVGLRVTTGLVLSDRILREDLFTTPTARTPRGGRSPTRGTARAAPRYAVTPRFSLSCTDADPGVGRGPARRRPALWFTSHLNENVEEIARRAPTCSAATTRHLRAARAARPAQRVRARRAPEPGRAADAAGRHGAAVAHCPTSNAALGSGLFPLARTWRSASGSRSGRTSAPAPGFSLFKEGLQAYFIQQLLGREGPPPDARRTCCTWRTSAGADALGLADTVGDF